MNHYEGIERDEPRPAARLDEAVRLGGERPPSRSPAPLLEAIAEDLWR